MAKRAKKKGLTSRPTDGSSAPARKPARNATSQFKFWPSWTAILQATVIAAAVFAVFWPALQGNFVSDDVFYLGGNALLQEPDRLWKAWFVPGSFIE